jgi:CBS domain-containing protein
MLLDSREDWTESRRSQYAAVKRGRSHRPRNRSDEARNFVCCLEDRSNPGLAGRFVCIARNRVEQVAVVDGLGVVGAVLHVDFADRVTITPDEPLSRGVLTMAVGVPGAAPRRGDLLTETPR